MKRPNIVFILSDDLGWCDLGAGGSSFYESPNIDRIAREGMLFTRAYATCQVCSPSRASILTGKYTPRHGITDYLGAKCGKEWRTLERHNQMLPAECEPGLRHNEITFAEVMRREGYRTFFAGKWHLGEKGTDPDDFGFEVNKGGYRAGWSSGGYFAPWNNPYLPPGPDGESLPIRLGTETAKFITEHKDEPFLAYLSFYSVHGPIQTSQDRWEKFRLKATAQGLTDKRFIFVFDVAFERRQGSPVGRWHSRTALYSDARCCGTGLQL